MFTGAKRNRRVTDLILVGVAAVCASVTSASAQELRLPAIFTSHAVLQQNAAVPVWGWGQPGAPVSVAIAGQSLNGQIDAAGRWRVDLAPTPAGGPHQLTVSSGSQQIVLEDILFGEVWFASGQSNMEWAVNNTDNWEQESAQCANDAIRFAKVPHAVSPEPLEDLQAFSPWTPCTGEALTNQWFSAVGYYFAKYVHAGLGVPVGIVSTSWGGTRIEPWTPPAGFEQLPSLAPITAEIERNKPTNLEYQTALRDGIAQIEAWLPAARQALETGVFPPALPAVKTGSSLNHQGAPTALYNAMVAPMVPYANRGFIWYQGEGNRGEGMLYREKMEALIRGWRTVWQRGDLACYFAQLAPYNYGNYPQALPEIWEAQAAAAAIPGTGMAVINDIGNLADIHPTNKDDVGKRLALLALNRTYGLTDVVCDSPAFDRFAVEGSALRVHFKHAQSLSTRDGAAPTWFTICGPDGVYRAANAAIDGTSVVLAADGVVEPCAVRFAWSHEAEPNLTNEAGLPASAFRAGDLPVEGALRTNAPEAEGLQLLYALDPTRASWVNGAMVYDVDNRRQFAGKTIERVAYYLQIASADAGQWVYAEMDPFTQNLDHLGVPVPEVQFQQDVSNLFVKTNVEGLPSGGIASGAIEFWACNYGPPVARGLQNASADRFDFDDQMNMDVNPGYGCLQVHDVSTATTLLAYNNHRAGRGADVGIGNCTGQEPDWTFSHSAQNWESGRFLVLVKCAPEAAPAN